MLGKMSIDLDNELQDLCLTLLFISRFTYIFTRLTTRVDQMSLWSDGCCKGAVVAFTVRVLCLYFFSSRCCIRAVYRLLGVYMCICVYVYLSHGLLVLSWECWLINMLSLWKEVVMFFTLEVFNFPTLDQWKESEWSVLLGFPAVVGVRL